MQHALAVAGRRGLLKKSPRGLVALEGALQGRRQLGRSGLRGSVRYVRTFGAIQRADIALAAGDGETLIGIDTPRDRELKQGDVVELQPTRFRIFSA